MRDPGRALARVSLARRRDHRCVWRVEPRLSSPLDRWPRMRRPAEPITGMSALRSKKHVPLHVKRFVALTIQTSAAISPAGTAVAQDSRHTAKDVARETPARSSEGPRAQYHADRTSTSAVTELYNHRGLRPARADERRAPDRIAPRHLQPRHLHKRPSRPGVAIARGRRTLLRRGATSSDCSTRIDARDNPR